MREYGRLGLLVAALAVQTPARAEPLRPAEKPKPPSRVEHRVDFRADKVVLTPDTGSLDLSGKVVVESHRFRLTSDAMTLSRTHRGVHVTGGGNLALCSCPKPPVTFGFGSADLAPPTDVLLANATLRVGPVPVFWSPYLWLRSPTRVGLHPPWLAYRGEEGFLLGSGLHVPFASEEGTRAALDASVGAYLRGGVRAEAVLRSPSGRSAVAIDVFRREALDVVSAHAFEAGAGAMISERIDWLSGKRALVAPSELARVALARDRLRVGASSAALGTGFDIDADAPRDAGIRQLASYGAGLTLARGGMLGPRSEYAFVLGTRSFYRETGAGLVARGSAALSASAALAGLLSTTSLREQVEFLTLESERVGDLRSELRSRLGVPLGKRTPTWLHTIEPFAEAALATGTRTASELTTAFSDLTQPARALVALAGVDTALSVPSARRAGELSVGAGAIAEADARYHGVVAGRARLDAGVVRAAVDARWLPVERASELSVRAEAQTEAGVRAALRVASAVSDASVASGFWSDDFARPKGATLARSGVSAGGRLGVPWGGRVITEVGADVDISEKRWLSSSAALGYRHPCRCLSLLGAASRRVGRNGFDLGVNVEVVPR